MDQIKPPSLIDQMKSLGEAVKNWTVKDSFRVVPPDVLEFRKNACNSCEHWDQEAFAGIGRCKVCGCSATKLYIPSASCPLPEKKWKAVATVDEKGNATHTNSTPLKRPLVVLGKTQPSGSVP